MAMLAICDKDANDLRLLGKNYLELCSRDSRIDFSLPAFFKMPINQSVGPRAGGNVGIAKSGTI